MKGNTKKMTKKTGAKAPNLGSSEEDKFDIEYGEELLVENKQ